MTQPVPINRPMSSLEWALLLSLSVLWGGSFFFNGIAVKELPTLTVVVARVVLAGAILLVVFRFLGSGLPRTRRVWLAFFVMGFLNNVLPFSLIVWGQSHIASGVASILNATTPLFTVIVAHGLTSDEKMTGGRLVGVVVGLIGVAYMIGAGSIASLGSGVIAQIACLAAALSYAFAGVFGRGFKSMGVTPMQTATGQVTASSLMLAPVMMLVDRPWMLPVPSMASVLAALIHDNGAILHEAHEARQSVPSDGIGFTGLARRRVGVNLPTGGLVGATPARHGTAGIKPSAICRNSACWEQLVGR
jgi:drug/metabolite transporter (DMT)-like permease